MAYEIALEMPGLDKVMSGFEKIIDKQKELNDKAKELEQLVPSGRGGRGGGGGRAGGILGGGGGWSDPWERLDRLNIQKSLGQMEGLSDDDMKGLNLAIARAQRGVDKGEKELNKQPKTQAELIMDALMTSRVGFSGGKMQVMPLMNRMADAGLIDPSKYMDQIMNLGGGRVGALITKLAIPAAVGAAAALGAYKVIDGAASIVRGGSAAAWTGGGTPGQTGQMSALGSFIGLTAEQSAQRAVELGDRLKSGGYGASYMRSKGIIDQGPWTINKTDNYLRVVEELRNIKSDQQAIRVARDLGMTGELGYRDLSDRTFQRLKESLGDQGDPALRRAEAEYRATKSIVGNQFQQGWVSFSTPYMKAMSGDWRAMLQTMPGLGWVGQALVGGALGGGDDAKGTSRSQGKADENTKAVQELTRTMKETAEKLGAGPRARGAVPSAWKYEQMENALQSDAISLGAFFI